MAQRTIELKFTQVESSEICKTLKNTFFVCFSLINVLFCVSILFGTDACRCAETELNDTVSQLLCALLQRLTELERHEQYLRSCQQASCPSSGVDSGSGGSDGDKVSVSYIFSSLFLFHIFLSTCVTGTVVMLTCLDPELCLFIYITHTFVSSSSFCSI